MMQSAPPFAGRPNRRKSGIPDWLPVPERAEENRTFAVPRCRTRRPKQLEAGPFAADVASFRLHLAAENKSGKTIQIYTEAVRWFAAAHLLCATSKTRWEQVEADDIRRWTVQLLGEYSDAYAYQQFRALRQFFRWLAAEDGIPDPMSRLRPPKVREKPVPYFGSVELSRLERACRGNSFEDRRDAAIIAVLLATGIRLAELTGIRYHPIDPYRSDVDLDAREIRVRGKGGKVRIVRITHEAARRLDRYLRIRSRHPLAHFPQLWLGSNNRCPLSRTGIYQIVARRGEEAGVKAYPHRFRHHFSHTWLDQGGAEGDLMELNGWSSPQMLERYGASARGARARRNYDLIMHDNL
jgi:site-specific recombinase XerD